MPDHKPRRWVQALCILGILACGALFGWTTYVRFSHPELTETQLLIYMLGGDVD